MKLFGAILVLVMGIAISIVAAWFSVTGMVALFNASAIGVLAMMISLEAGKLVASGWLKVNWKNPAVSFLHRAYLLFAVLVLCLITSIGIYGYLAAGHLEQAAPRADLAVQSQPLQLQLEQKNAENERLGQRLTQIDQNIGVFLQNDQASKGLKASESLKKERDAIQTKIDTNNTAINDLNTKLAPIKMQSNAVEAKLGPVKYIAALFGWEDEESAVRLVILILMLAFDPLAVVLLLSAMTTFKEIEDDKKGPKKDSIEDAPYNPMKLEDEYWFAEEQKAKEEGDIVEEPKIELKPAAPLTPVDLSSWYRPMHNMGINFNIPPPSPKKDEPTFELLNLEPDVLEPEEPESNELAERLLELDVALAGERAEKIARNFEIENLKNKINELEQREEANEVEDEQVISALKSELDHINAQLERECIAHDNLRDTYVSLLDEMAKKTMEGEPNKDIDRDTLIAILERHPGILNEIEQIVEDDVEKEMSDREKLLDLLEKNPGVINDMAAIIAGQFVSSEGKNQGRGWVEDEPQK